jgi:uncharacterized membrane protein
MTTLTVLKFQTVDGAENALDLIKDLSKQKLINLHDAAIVTWPEGKKKPKTKQLTNMAGIGALDGAFWGMLFGLIFFVPLFGMAIGAAMGALTGSFTDVGIDDDFIKSIRDKVTEGTSALFLMTSGAVMDKVTEAAKGLEFELIASNLSKEAEDNLRTAFGQE